MTLTSSSDPVICFARRTAQLDCQAPVPELANNRSLIRRKKSMITWTDVTLASAARAAVHRGHRNRRDQPARRRDQRTGARPRTRGGPEHHAGRNRRRGSGHHPGRGGRLALNLHSRTADAFTHESEQVGLLFAAHAAIAYAGVRKEAQLAKAVLGVDPGQPDQQPETPRRRRRAGRSGHYFRRLSTPAGAVAG